MACCTAITYVNKKLVGDPLDVKMFEATGWNMDEPDNSEKGADAGIIIAQFYPHDVIKSVRTSEKLKIPLPKYKLQLVRRFDFSSAL
jgi:cation-transporting ATPase 13A2